jgi:hypothetical protein
MSWDVMVFHLRERPQSLDDLSEDTMLPLGAAAEVRRAISAVLSGVDWSDCAWGLYGGDGFSIEFNVGKEDPIQSMSLLVRGGGDAIADIMKLVVANGWLALDCSTSEFLDPAAPSDEGWVGFQKYRDKILKRSIGEGAVEG